MTPSFPQTLRKGPKVGFQEEGIEARGLELCPGLQNDQGLRPGLPGAEALGAARCPAPVCSQTPRGPPWVLPTPVLRVALPLRELPSHHRVLLTQRPAQRDRGKAGLCLRCSHSLAKIS